jgi:hypothetical protein
LVHKPATLGILPIGTFNNIARSIGTNQTFQPQIKTLSGNTFQLQDRQHSPSLNVTQLNNAVQGIQLKNNLDLSKKIGNVLDKPQLHFNPDLTKKLDGAFNKPQLPFNPDLNKKITPAILDKKPGSAEEAILYAQLKKSIKKDPKRFKNKEANEMDAIIREEEPPKPSTKLSTAAGLPALAANRGTEPAKLTKLVRGELDWIVMKALEKDRTRRFETANGLASDVQRFLKNEPVEARPPSNVYRLQKLVRRNKTAFAGVAAVVAALVLGLGLSLYLFIQERHALRSEREALARAVAAEHKQAELREQAERGLEIERHMQAMRGVGDKFTVAGRYMGQGLFDKAEEVMTEVPLTIPQCSVIYNTLGEIYSRRGQWADAIRVFNKAMIADPTNHITYHDLAPVLVQIGDMDNYRSLCQRALNQFSETKDPIIAERIAKDCLMFQPSNGNLERLGKMAATAITGGPTNNAWPYFQFVKGLAEYRLGHYAGAQEWLGKIVLGVGVPPRDVEVQATLAMAQYRSGQTNAAEAALAAGIKIVESEPNKSDRIDWNDQIIAKTLLREAHTLVVGRPPPADVLK